MARRVVLLVAVCWACAFSPQIARSAEPLEITRIEVGFAGHYRVGFWTPVRITFETKGEPITGALELETVDGDGTKCRLPASPITVAPGKPLTVQVPVKFGRISNSLTARIRAGDRLVLEKTFGGGGPEHLRVPTALHYDEPLLVTLGEMPGFTEAIDAQYHVSRHSPTVAVVPNAGTLPDVWVAYEGIDAVCLAGRPELPAELAAASAQTAALIEWVRLGGTLIVSSGEQAAALFGTGGPLAAIAPGKIRGVKTVDDAAALESFSGTRHQVPISSGDDETHPIKLADLTEPSGVVLLSLSKTPLVVRSPQGLGQVTFVGADFGSRPLSDWRGRGAALQKVLAATLGNISGEGEAAGSGEGYLGITDMAAQLRGALDEFPGVEVMSFSTVAMLIIGYMVIVGPLDFLVLRKLGRMELTWITFPLVVVGACILAAVLSSRSKRSDVQLNKIDIVDTDLSSGIVRGTTWADVYSPTANSYDLSLRPTQGARPQVLFSWLGLAGQGVGSMESSGVGPQLFRQAYSYSPDRSSLHDVPIGTRASKSFDVRWWGPTAWPLEAHLRRVPDENQVVLAGTVRNNLKTTLRKGQLAFGTWMYSLGDLEPGQSITLEPGDRLDLEQVLRHSQLVHEEHKDSFYDRSTPYRIDSRDVPRIVEQMMFFEISGGENYTALRHRYAQSLDFSTQLGMQRAVIIFEGDEPATEVELEHSESDFFPKEVPGHAWTFYRFLVTPE